MRQRILPLLNAVWSVDARRAAHAVADLEAMASELQSAISFVRDRAFAEFRGDLSVPSSPAVLLPTALPGVGRSPMVAAASCASGPAAPLTVAVPPHAIAAPVPSHAPRAESRLPPQPAANSRGKIPRFPDRSPADPRVPTPHPEVVIELTSDSSTSSCSDEESSTPSEADEDFTFAWVNDIINEFE